MSTVTFIALAIVVPAVAVLAGLSLLRLADASNQPRVRVAIGVIAAVVYAALAAIDPSFFRRSVVFLFAAIGWSIFAWSSRRAA